MPDQADVSSWLSAQTWPDLRALIAHEPTTLYVHPYGFLVCRVETGLFPGWQIRVHLWPGQDEMVEELIRNGIRDQLVHCHGWNLWSAVCLGSLKESQYELATDVIGPKTLYRVVSDYASGNSRLFPELEHVRPVLLSEHNRDRSSGAYLIPSGRYHATVVAAGPAVSVVATSRAHTGSSLVIGPLNQGQMITNNRRTVENAHSILGTYDDIYRELAGDADRWASFVFLLDDRGCALLVRPTRRPDLWQPIGGRSERADKDPLTTVIREVREEVGIQLEASQLGQLTVVDRDVGEGKVHFWFARVDSRRPLNIAHREILEAAWIPVDDFVDLPMYGGTRTAAQDLHRRLAQRREGQMP